MKTLATLCLATALVLTAVPARADDNAIKERVLSAIRSDPDANLRGMTLDVRDGVAIFSGHVNRHEEIDNALAQTLMVNGVRNVESNVTISGGRGNLEEARASYNPKSAYPKK